MASLTDIKLLYIVYVCLFISGALMVHLVQTFLQRVAKRDAHDNNTFTRLEDVGGVRRGNVGSALDFGPFMVSAMFKSVQ